MIRTGRQSRFARQPEPKTMQDEDKEWESNAILKSNRRKIFHLDLPYYYFLLSWFSIFSIFLFLSCEWRRIRCCSASLDGTTVHCRFVRTFSTLHSTFVTFHISPQTHSNAEEKKMDRNRMNTHTHTKSRTRKIERGIGIKKGKERRRKWLKTWHSSILWVCLCVSGSTPSNSSGN